MKKTDKKDEMRSEYDFSGGVRGKHFNKLQNGHQTVIHKSDGSAAVTVTRPIILAPDVQAYFPDAESVNQALRGLIALVPNKNLQIQNENRNIVAQRSYEGLSARFKIIRSVVRFLSNNF